MSIKLKAQWLPLLLILAILSLFVPALLKPNLILFPTFSQFSDIMVIHWPKAKLMAEHWQAGFGLPYWTPLILSGMPLAANQLAMLFYPPAWLFLILPLELVFNLLFVFHFVGGGLGVYYLLRENFNVSPTAALLGGLTFALNGKWLAHAAGGHVSLVGAVGWLPWLAVGIHLLLDEGAVSAKPQGRKRFLICMFVAVALAMQIFTHTLILIYSLYLMAAMVMWHFVVKAEAKFWHKDKWLTVVRANRNRFIALLAIPMLAGLLGAVQLLPLLELAQFSNRSLSYEQAATYAASPLQLVIGLFLPTPQAGHELIIYLGLIPLLLAPFGLSRANRWSWFYGGLFILAILFALGPLTPIHGLFYNFAPGFGWVRTPVRMFFVGALAVAVLAGFGVERLQQLRCSAQATRQLTRLTVGLGGLALLVGLGLAFGFEQLNRASFALAIFVPLGLSLILLRIKRILSAQMTVILLTLLLYLDLASFGWSMIRFTPLAEALAPGRVAADYLAQQPGLFRVYSPSYSLPIQTAAAANLNLADGVEPVHLAIYDQYMAQAGGYQDASFSVTIPNFGGGPLESALEQTQPNLKLLGLLNVKYLAAAFPMDWPGLALEKEIDGLFIYRNERAMPRAWLAGQDTPGAADWLAQVETLPLTKTVAVETPRLQKSGQVKPSAVRIIHYSANRLELEVEAIDGPGSWLVLSEIWYPGWQATVNGLPRPVEQVNGLLRGVYLDGPSPYHITLIYRPWTIVWGGWLSSLTAGFIILSSLGIILRRSSAGGHISEEA